MIEAYKLFWKNYVKFEGTTTRSEYWYATLMNVIIEIAWLVLILIVAAITGVSVAANNGDTNLLSGVAVGILVLLYVIILIFGLATLVPNISMTIRRLRDGGYPWPFIFFAFIPMVGGIVLIVFMCMPGTTKKNSN